MTGKTLLYKGMKNMNRKQKRLINKKKIGACVCIGLLAFTIKMYPGKIIEPGVWSWDMDNKAERIIMKSGIECDFDYEFTTSIEQPKESKQIKIKPVKASKNCLDMIKQFEGLKLTAYKLNGEKNFTIGYGTSNKSIKAGQTITEHEANEMLQKEVDKITKLILSKNLDLNQNQLDALVSFTYNVGPGNLNKLIKNRTTDEIGEHITAYTKSASISNRSGLQKRREAEKNLFERGCD